MMYYTMKGHKSSYENIGKEAANKLTHGKHYTAQEYYDITGDELIGLMDKGKYQFLAFEDINDWARTI